MLGPDSALVVSFSREFRAVELDIPSKVLPVPAKLVLFGFGLIPDDLRLLCDSMFEAFSPVSHIVFRFAAPL